MGSWAVGKATADHQRRRRHGLRSSGRTWYGLSRWLPGTHQPHLHSAEACLAVSHTASSRSLAPAANPDSGLFDVDTVSKLSAPGIGTRCCPSS